MTPDSTSSTLQKNFIATFGESARPVKAFFAPGRVNLIGDHTDYNGGLVFPCAINTGNTLLIREREDNRVKLASANFEFNADLEPHQLAQKHGDQWINYPLAVIDQLQRMGTEIPGIECLYSGNVPNAAGLSSSAAIEIVTAFALNTICNRKLDLLSQVKLCQKAENEFVGVACGIMDQFAVAMAQQGHAMQLDCQTLDFNQVPLHLGDYQFVLANTNQRRELSDSGYNTRVKECADALQTLQQQHDITQLAQLSPQQLDESENLFDNDTLRRRARHVVDEHDRVKQAVLALQSRQLPEFGKLMNESHASLRDNYQVSSTPLDELVSAAQHCEGVLGSRLTGAGFGGCTVSLVHKQAVENFKHLVAGQYQKNTGLSADFYLFEPGDGVREIRL